MDSLITRLEQQLQSIESQGLEFLNASTIERYPDDDPFDEPVIILIANKYHWGEDNSSQKLLQIKLLRLYSSWFEQFQLLFHDSSQEIQRQITQVNTSINDLLEKKNGWGVPSTIDEAKTLFKKQLKTFYQLLQVFNATSKTKVVLVPDTNALIKSPDVANYATVAGQPEYTIVIIPTVLSELDKLKRDHRDADFRKKVESVIRRLKGYRQQGNMREGVTVNKTVTVKMLSREPNFNETLSWLDPMNNDDRIIASTLELQREEPASTVILVTSDINHQNKAETANVPYAEPPEIKGET